MRKGSFEEMTGVQRQIREDGTYGGYQNLGGIINETDYKSVLERAARMTTFDKSLIVQAESIAEYAKIVLDNSSGVDPRVKLYAVLRSDNKPEGVNYQMPDQCLFAEALRMSGDKDALNKLIGAYHKIGTHCPICSRTVASGEECR